MSRLMQALREDPSASFEIKAELPTGNTLCGTVGPVVNGRIVAAMGFKNQPPSDRDMEIAKEVMDKLMGGPADTVVTTKNAAERKRAMVDMRRFMGGGVG